MARKAALLTENHRTYGVRAQFTNVRSSLMRYNTYTEYTPISVHIFRELIPPSGCDRLSSYMQVYHTLLELFRTSIHIIALYLIAEKLCNSAFEIVSQAFPTCGTIPSYLHCRKTNKTIYNYQLANNISNPANMVNRQCYRFRPHLSV